MLYKYILIELIHTAKTELMINDATIAVLSMKQYLHLRQLIYIPRYVLGSHFHTNI